ncbi:hypothetical protein I4U23_023307 [Adineta vaga]|nr:hypothetical protein I4U23_023307 [Adineta vaga]
MFRFLYMLVLLAIIVSLGFAAKRFAVCDPPCQTNGHVPTCCNSHGYSDGFCRSGSAYCN